MTPAVTSEILPVAPRRADFADWLSPILVKELRQGLQSRIFVSAFVLVQAAMILFVGLRLISVSGHEAEDSFMFDGVFGFCVWLPLLILMPARGLGAIGEEVRAQTLDLVQLTRLSAFRIAWGKWLALVAQTFLLATSMLPYAVLRYYFGRVDVVGELMTLALLLIASMLLTAGAVAVSAAPIAFRIVTLMMMIPVFMAYTAVRTAMSFAGSSVSGSSGLFLENEYLKMLLWLIPTAVLYIYFFLELAASKIAPLAENHSVRKRTLALLLCTAIAVSGLVFDMDIFRAVLLLSAPVVGFVILEALCENPVPLPGIYRPFALRGLMGRLIGRLMYPGWATGTLFATLAFALIGGGFLWAVRRLGSTASDSQQLGMSLAAPLTFFSVISPLPILQLFPRFKKRFWPYLLVQSLSVLLLIIGMIVADSPSPDHKDALKLIAPIPTAALFAFSFNTSDGSLAASILKIALAADALLLVWVLFLVYRQMRLIRQMERLSLGEPESTLS